MFWIIFIGSFIVSIFIITPYVYNKIYQGQLNKYGVSKSQIDVKDVIDIGLNMNKQKIWEGEVHISGDQIFLTDLTIKPGTKIIIDANSDNNPSNFDIEIDADGFNDNDPSRLKSYADTHTSFFFVGSLNAIGTKEKPIIFTTSSKNPYYANWGGINLVGKASKLEHVIVEYSRNGISVPKENPKMSIKNSIVRHAMWGCFSLAGSNGIYENNIAIDCGHEGFDIKGDSKIINNTVIDSHTSIVVLGGTPLIINNKFQDEIYIIDGNPIIKDNVIDESMKCKKGKVWTYGNYHIPCFGEPFVK
jgi:hypothetical protein